MAKGWFAITVCAIGLGVIFQANAAQAGLEDILYEKGHITKEEWIKAKADSEKVVEEEHKKRDQEFPISMRYKDGFDFQTRDGKFEMLIQNRFQFRYSYDQESDAFTNAAATAFNDKDVSSFRVRRA
ncbi:MAG: hypothetical protein OEV77_11610, partial [Nitrospira sp.]|nr:hypothetical protein [Nitrospira sp.]